VRANAGKRARGGKAHVEKGEAAGSAGPGAEAAELGLEGLLRQSADLLRRTAHVTVPVVLAFHAPLSALELSSAEPLPFAGTALYALVTMVGDLALLVACAQALRGEPIALGEAFATGLRGYGRVILTEIILEIRVLLVLPLLVVPAVLRLASYAVAVQVALCEDEMGHDACVISEARLRGKRGLVLLFLLVGLLPVLAASGVWWLASVSAAAPDAAPSAELIEVAAEALVALASIPVGIVMPAVLYHRTLPRSVL